jgi:hypothetical protein
MSVAFGSCACHLGKSWHGAARETCSEACLSQYSPCCVNVKT